MCACICTFINKILNSYIVSVLLTLYPRYGNVLGGTVVEVFGPCFDVYVDHNITCSFDGVKVAGVYVDDSIICVSPALTTLGRVDFVLSISGTTADQFEKTTFYSCKYSCKCMYVCVYTCKYVCM